MAKRKNNAAPEKVRTVLILSKKDYEAELTSFIERFKSLKTKQITTEADLDLAEQEANRISANVEEFLKAAFNNPDNEYRDTFKKNGSFIGVADVMRGINIHHPAKRLEYHREGLEGKIECLERFRETAKYLQSTLETSAKSSDSDSFTEEEKIELDKRIEEVLNKLHELQLGQEIIFNEIESLKGLKNLDKKTFSQVVKGKIVDIGLSKLVDNDLLKWVYDKLTNDNDLIPPSL